MIDISTKPASAPFQMPSHFDVWLERTRKMIWDENLNKFVPHHVFKAHIKCESLAKTVEGKPFVVTSKEVEDAAWVEFMTMLSNTMVFSVMTPQVAKRILGPEKEENQ